MKLYNSSVAVTGGNDGLGLALVKLLSTICKMVYVIDISDKCEAVENLENVTYIKNDLSKKDLQRLNVDVFISNVGMNKGPKLIKDYTDEDIRDMISLNIESHLYCLKNMNFKKFVFIDSVMSIMGVEYYAMYCACKSFIKTFNKSVQREGYDTLIVYPYKLNTKMFSEVKDFGTLDVDDVAQSIKAAIENDSKDIYLPSYFRYVETINGFTPEFLRNFFLDRVIKYFVDEKAILDKRSTFDEAKEANLDKRSTVDEAKEANLDKRSTVDEAKEANLDRRSTADEAKGANLTTE